ncbi:hypothetical protein BpHYR1_022707 [Brachionus plicatilis]|uniref:Uncharacterized protein n=1 Tax=Brachionus plicatilis TaxID=10195 RepID=A0A3M7T6Z6_BRAPC|nr:hypothetical protein BpHYR1_022707 [Brachionus plicatilis]
MEIILKQLLFNIKKNPNIKANDEKKIIFLEKQPSLFQNNCHFIIVLFDYDKNYELIDSLHSQVLQLPCVTCVKAQKTIKLFLNK